MENFLHPKFAPNEGQFASRSQSGLQAMFAANRLAFSIEDFCSSIGGITRQHFHALIKRGKGPQTFKAGKRTLVSRQAAAEWISRMEAEALAEKGGLK